ncbi:toxin-antitoxin system YwqK family antitoxin [Fusobacterium nucleatum]|uniref:toxin-antitoxin system YwqK family antitoxin n=1 Tax=Fusobacterium nucleatum TaxID=851 RepID=UPI0030D57CB2
MKKGIILLALIFGACVNLENIGGNSGGEVKEIKTTDTNISASKNYEKRNGVLYVDNILANGKQEYKEKNGVIIKGNYREGLPDGVQEKYYPSGKIYGKINIINNKTEGTETTYYENGKTLSQLDYTQGKLISGKIYYENGDLLTKIEGKKMTIYYSSGKKLFTMDKSDVAVYHENGKEVFSNSDQGVKINGEDAEKSILDMFSKDKLLKTAFYLLTSSTVQAEYKNGKPSIQLQGTTAVMYYKSGKILLELSPSLDGTVNSKIYYENGQLMQVEDRNKSGRSVKVYDKAGNLISDTTYSKEHEIRQMF